MVSEYLIVPLRLPWATKNVYDYQLYHLVIFVIKELKTWIHFCSSTRGATKHSTSLKIVVDVPQFCSFFFFLITRKAPRNKLVIWCWCQTSDKENHYLIFYHKRKRKNCLYMYTHTNALLKKKNKYEEHCFVSHACI